MHPRIFCTFACMGFGVKGLGRIQPHVHARCAKKYAYCPSKAGFDTNRDAKRSSSSARWHTCGYTCKQCDNPLVYTFARRFRLYSWPPLSLPHRPSSVSCPDAHQQLRRCVCHGCMRVLKQTRACTCLEWIHVRKLTALSHNLTTPAHAQTFPFMPASVYPGYFPPPSLPASPTGLQSRRPRVMWGGPAGAPEVGGFLQNMQGQGALKSPGLLHPFIISLQHVVSPHAYQRRTPKA